MTPRLLSDMVFEGGEAASAVVAAWRFLADAETGVRTDYTKAPVGVVSRAWKPLVFPETGRVDRRAYTFCVLEAMRDHLRRRDVSSRPAAVSPTPEPSCCRARAGRALALRSAGHWVCR